MSHGRQVVSVLSAASRAVMRATAPVSMTYRLFVANTVNPRTGIPITTFYDISLADEAQRTTVSVDEASADGTGLLQIGDVRFKLVKSALEPYLAHAQSGGMSSMDHIVCEGSDYRVIHYIEPAGETLTIFARPL